NPKPQTPNPKLQTPNPTPQTLNLKPQTLHPTPYTLNPTPQTPNPNPQPPNPNPQTRNPKAGAYAVASCSVIVDGVPRPELYRWYQSATFEERRGFVVAWEHVVLWFVPRIGHFWRGIGPFWRGWANAVRRPRVPRDDGLCTNRQGD
ncbi:hypothetical protein T484DRAFT_1648761, partial [Baffinella frigidus]